MSMRTDEVCYRCGKKKEITISESEVVTRIEAEKKRKDYAQEIREVLYGLDAGLGPEVIICTRRKDLKTGEYEIEMLDNLCETNGSSESSRKFRGCRNKVMNLINEAMHKSKKDRAVAEEE